MNDSISPSMHTDQYTGSLDQFLTSLKELDVVCHPIIFLMVPRVLDLAWKDKYERKLG